MSHTLPLVKIEVHCAVYHTETKERFQQFFGYLGKEEIHPKLALINIDYKRVFERKNETIEIISLVTGKSIRNYSCSNIKAMQNYLNEIVN